MSDVNPVSATALARVKEVTDLDMTVVAPLLELLRPVAALTGKTLEEEIIGAVQLYLETCYEVYAAECARRGIVLDSVREPANTRKR